MGDIDLEAIFYKKTQGSSKGYDQFISTLADSRVKDGVLLKCLKSLKDCVTLLDREHEEMVGVLLKIDWMLRSEKVIEIYQSLILNLISVHTDYLRACLRMVIKPFAPRLPTLASSLTGEEVERNNHIFVRLHSLLKNIVKIVPMSPTLLMPLLADLYPYMTKNTFTQECYQRNLFEITSYVPAQRQTILELVIDRMIKLDVRAPRHEVIEASQAEMEADESGVFTMEDCSQGHQFADTLDILMTHLFQYLHDTCYSEEVLNWEATKKLYRELLYVFEKIILPTFDCAHVQFVMFYLASIRQEICDGFLDYLWKLVQNPNHQSVYRQSAVAYMASLLARGKFVTIDTATKAVELMVKWAHNYTQTCQDCVMADVTHHGPFYSVCQGIFYVFAFRQKDIFEMKKGLKWAESLQFQHLVQSRLNPLKVCLPIIVKSFASITRQHQLAFCDHIIQQNNRSFLPVVSNGTQKMLESFFPFDPYLLERSSRFIEPHYREYDRKGEVEDSNETSDEEEDLFANDIRDSQLKMAISLTEKSDLDLMSYGTSPGFKHLN